VMIQKFASDNKDKFSTPNFIISPQNYPTFLTVS